MAKHRGKRLTEWRPKAYVPRVNGNVHVYVDDEPNVIPLRRFKYDKALRASVISSCCDCNLVHTFTYELYRDADGQFWLNMRAIRHPKDNKPKPKRARRKRNG